MQKVIRIPAIPNRWSYPYMGLSFRSLTPLAIFSALHTVSQSYGPAVNVVRLDQYLLAKIRIWPQSDHARETHYLLVTANNIEEFVKAIWFWCVLFLPFLRFCSAEINDQYRQIAYSLRNHSLRVPSSNKDSLMYIPTKQWLLAIASWPIDRERKVAHCLNAEEWWAENETIQSHVSYLLMPHDKTESEC